MNKFWERVIAVVLEPPPPVPGDVFVLDGHHWRLLGKEDTSDWAETSQPYARDVWRCIRCHTTSKVYQAPPKVWRVQNDQYIAAQCEESR